MREKIQQGIRETADLKNPPEYHSISCFLWLNKDISLYVSLSTVLWNKVEEHICDKQCFLSCWICITVNRRRVYVYVKGVSRLKNMYYSRKETSICDRQWFLSYWICITVERSRVYLTSSAFPFCRICITVKRRRVYVTGKAFRLAECILHLKG